MSLWPRLARRGMSLASFKFDLALMLPLTSVMCGLHVGWRQALHLQMRDRPGSLQLVPGDHQELCRKVHISVAMCCDRIVTRRQTKDLGPNACAMLGQAKWTSLMCMWNKAWMRSTLHVVDAGKACLMALRHRSAQSLSQQAADFLGFSILNPVPAPQGCQPPSDSCTQIHNCRYSPSEQLKFMQEAQKSLAAMEAQQAAGTNVNEQADDDTVIAGRPGGGSVKKGTGYWEGWDDDNIPAAPRMFSAMPGQLGQMAEEAEGVQPHQLLGCPVLTC